MRSANISRKTKETDIDLSLNLDGGDIEIYTGIGFFDHMLNAFAFHGGFGITVRAVGDLAVDCHHTVEDVGIVLGTAFNQSLGDRRGIRRFADTFVPMDEALAFSAVDISGRSFLVFDATFPQERVGDFDACMTEEFFRAFCTNANLTLHIKSMYGSNSHHIIEAIFKACARSLRIACDNTGDDVRSTKGLL